MPPYWASMISTTDRPDRSRAWTAATAAAFAAGWTSFGSGRHTGTDGNRGVGRVDGDGAAEGEADRVGLPDADEAVGEPGPDEADDEDDDGEEESEQPARTVPPASSSTVRRLSPADPGRGPVTALRGRRRRRPRPSGPP